MRAISEAAGPGVVKPAALAPNRILLGDAIERLRELPDESVHCVVTSPPYWGLRDYGTGKWEGGDPKCKHKAGTARPDHSGGNLKPSRGEQLSTLAYQIPQRQTCSKCGGRRVDRQIGLEAAPSQYIEKMKEVFREVRRVLRPDGLLCLNMGDSYVDGGRGTESGSTLEGTRDNQQESRKVRVRETASVDLPAKNLLGMPWRLALALQDDGWWLRQDVIEEVDFYCPCGCGFILEQAVTRYGQDREIIWKKPNTMPESVFDRCTKSHEYVFLMAKSGDTTFWTHPTKKGSRKKPKPDYVYEHRETGEVLKAPPEGWTTKDRIWRRENLWRGHDYFWDSVAIAEDVMVGYRGSTFTGPRDQATKRRLGEGERKSSGNKHRKPGSARGVPDPYEIWGRKGSAVAGSIPWSGTTRNKRSVWTITTEPFSEAHFATFPQELVETCILACTSEKGVCAACGAPWFRNSVSELVPTAKAVKTAVVDARDHAADPNDQGSNRQKDGHKPGHAHRTRTLGFQPTCDCKAPAKPAVVLDPFMGAGTVALVSLRSGRSFMGVELNPDYVKMAERRIAPELAQGRLC